MATMDEHSSNTAAKIDASRAGTFPLGGDLNVRRLGFGTMRLTGDGIWGMPRDPAEARRVLRRAVDRGVNLIDTADSYGPEVSEVHSVPNQHHFRCSPCSARA